MFAGFNLKIDKDFFGNLAKFEGYQRSWENSLDERNKEQLKERLESYVKAEEIDGTKIQNDWFPNIKADIFISHSHKDKNLAQAFAGWIKKNFGLKCFIDSDVWGYVDELLAGMNNRFSDRRKEGDYILYDHQSSNQVAAHVHLMLAAALQKMIDKTEAVILLNTDHSIQVSFDNKMNKSYSPWIYSEILFTSMVRKKPLVLYRKYPSAVKGLTESAKFFAFTQLKISYTVSLEHLTPLTEGDLRQWKEEWEDSRDKEKYPMDLLYQNTHKEELEFARDLFAQCGEKLIRQVKLYYEAEGMDPEKRKRVRQYLTCCSNIGPLLENHRILGRNSETGEMVTRCRDGIVCWRCDREECPQYRKRYDG